MEDDDDIRYFVSSVLRDAGYSVEAAENGAAALEHVERNPPCAILLDMRMPVMDGWEFAQHYHERSEPAAPIIVMTAAHDAHLRAAQVDAVGVLAKPFDLEDLLAAVAEALPSAT